jgi:hypothetical protein
MSVSVVAIPIALSYIVGVFLAGAAVPTILVAKELEYEINGDIDSKDYESEKDSFNLAQRECNEHIVINESNFIDKTFETPFVDKKILLKTLEEHGFINIQEIKGKITAEFQNYSVQFEKEAEEKPYRLLIKHAIEDDVYGKVNDLNEEYSMNVQEESYISIIEKLKNNNMELESEEVLDDNTIVLTVNLEG